jgi:urease accessory protein
VHITDDEATVLTGEGAVRLPLPGGRVTTAEGADLHRVLRAVHDLDPAASLRVPA